MNRRHGLKDVIIVLLLAAVILVPGTALFAEEAVDLFSVPAKATDLASLTKDQQKRVSAYMADPTSKGYKLLHVNLAATAKADALNFNFDAALPMKMNKSRLEMRDENDYSWFGEDRETGGSAILVVKGDEMVGSINYKGKMYRVRPVGGGLHAVIEVDPSRFPPEHPPEFEEIEKRTPRINLKDLLTPDADLADSCDTIDIIVAYTPGAKQQAGNIDALIQLAISETHQSYVNSIINPRLNLVHSYETNYTNDGSLLTDLNRFLDNNDGDMDEIHTYRSTYGADIAILITKNADYCGYAAAIMADASTGFAVVAQNCATGYYSFAHEIGHLQAARHNPEADPTNTPFAYGHGYYYGLASWRTTMSYNCPGGCTRINYWSNPNVSFGGVPTGTTGTNDNARVLNETACTVANFVQQTQPPPVTLTLQPDRLKIRVGRTDTLTATVKQGGAGLPNVTVLAQSGNTAIAEVSPPAPTNPSGETIVTVRGMSKGNTEVKASYQGKSDKAKVKVKKVPNGATWVLLAAVLAMALVLARRVERKQ